MNSFSCSTRTQTNSININKNHDTTWKTSVSVNQTKCIVMSPSNWTLFTDVVSNFFFGFFVCLLQLPDCVPKGYTTFALLLMITCKSETENLKPAFLSFVLSCVRFYNIDVYTTYIIIKVYLQLYERAVSTTYVQVYLHLYHIN